MKPNKKAAILPEAKRGRSGWVVATSVLAVLCLLLIAGVIAGFLLYNNSRQSEQGRELLIEGVDAYSTQVKTRSWIDEKQRVIRQFSSYPVNSHSSDSDTFDIYDFNSGYSASRSNGKCYISRITNTWEDFLASLERETTGHTMENTFAVAESTPVSEKDVRRMSGDKVADHCGDRQMFMLRDPTPEDEAVIRQTIASVKRRARSECKTCFECGTSSNGDKKICCISCDERTGAKGNRGAGADM